MTTVKTVFARGVHTVERYGEYVRLTFWADADDGAERIPVSQIVMERARYRLAVVELTNPRAIGD